MSRQKLSIPPYGVQVPQVYMVFNVEVEKILFL